MLWGADVLAFEYQRTVHIFGSLVENKWSLVRASPRGLCSVLWQDTLSPPWYWFNPGNVLDMTELEELTVLKRSPDLLYNVKIGQDQLQLIMKHILFYGGASILVM